MIGNPRETRALSAPRFPLPLIQPCSPCTHPHQPPWQHFAFSHGSPSGECPSQDLTPHRPPFLPNTVQMRPSSPPRPEAGTCHTSLLLCRASASYSYTSVSTRKGMPRRQSFGGYIIGFSSCSVKERNHGKSKNDCPH